MGADQINYSNTTPMALAGYTNITWQGDTSTPRENISACILTPSSIAAVTNNFLNSYDSITGIFGYASLSLPINQTVEAVTGGSTQAESGKDVVLTLDSSTVLATYTIIFPVNPNDLDSLTIFSDNSVTALTLTAQSTQPILGTVATLAVNGYATWRYNETLSKWIRTG
jgi:hypothetical protein